MTEKRFTMKSGHHGVTYISDHVNHKTYEFIESDHRNIQTLVKLLNDVIG